MKMVPIPPLSLIQETTRRCEILMVLAHVALDNHIGQKYRQAYREQADRGAWIILDNGAYELGKPLATDIMLQLAQDMNVKEIVLPDYPKDSKATLAATEKAVREYSQVFEINHGMLRLHYIPQGVTIREWGKCFHNMIRLHCTYFADLPFVIGIAKNYAQFVGGRSYLIDRFVREVYGAPGISFDVHLMGLEDGFQDTQKISTRYPWVRSTDSVKPFVYAAYHVKIPREGSVIPEYPGRPERYFELDLTGEVERKLSKENMVALEYRMGEADAYPEQ